MTDQIHSPRPGLLPDVGDLIGQRPRRLRDRRCPSGISGQHHRKGRVSVIAQPNPQSFQPRSIGSDAADHQYRIPVSLVGHRRPGLPCDQTYCEAQHYDARARYSCQRVHRLAFLESRLLIYGPVHANVRDQAVVALLTANSMPF
ncbi:hypothetical protein [Nocardia sp. GAS34]|uniref:hypothetical protein n=1 Tax=unclassified Nocardia TaxID=2637762 RepID=UPI003D1B02DA